MIVVDTNVVAYLLIPGKQTEFARKLFVRDPIWAAPLLWRSEFRSVLTGYIRQQTLPADYARELMDAAIDLFGGREFPVESASVFDLVRRSQCSAYDCEFVAIARDLDIPLLTWDKALLRDFPAIAVSAADYL